MNRVLLNTLYAMEGSGYLHLENEQIKVEVDKEVRAKVPLLHIGALVVRGHTLVSPGLLAACAERGIGVTWLDRGDHYSGSWSGPTAGNVLLRLAQYDVYRDEARSLEVARSIVEGKLWSSRNTLMRRARDAQGEAKEVLVEQRREVDALRAEVGRAQTVNALRGYEGQAAKLYFAAFDAAVDGSGFVFEVRSRRPPQNAYNALLSFVYTLITSDCKAACEGVGLDPQVGYLHEVRPGRPALALDLAEELRSGLGDRLAFSLINRKQLKLSDFEERAGGAVMLSKAGRVQVLTAYQQRKKDEIAHPLLQQNIPFGLVPHVQARLLARTLRGELATYTPFVYD
jgi:CRISP-associated protein Cas1